MCDDLQRLVVNFSFKGSLRYDSLEGKRYLVVNMTMLTHGVFNGSDGPLYYSAQELGKTPEVWNHKPVVIYHPEMGGKGISACSPDVIEKYKVGLIFNTKFDGKKLKAEAWLDEEKLTRLAPTIIDSLRRGKAVEISTGLFSDKDRKSGMFNSKNYVSSTYNYRPDHLAILPDKVGACSIADECGLLRNEEPDEENPMTTPVQTTPPNPTPQTPPAATVAPVTAPPTPQVPPTPAVPVGNCNPTNNTVQDYIRNAPPEIRDFLQQGAEFAAAERTRLVNVIVGNANNIFSREWLEHPQRAIQELQGIARLATASTPVPQAPPAPNGQTPPVQNTQPRPPSIFIGQNTAPPSMILEGPNTFLETPVFNFEKK